MRITEFSLSFVSSLCIASPAFEVQAILGLDKAEEIQTDGEEYKAGMDRQYGGFVRLGIPIEKQFLPFVALDMPAPKPA